MKIHHIQIEQFRAWRNLQLDVAADGVTVLHGPNETGKSTLLKFIRGALYGFQPQDEWTSGPRARRTSCGGALAVSHAGQRFTVHRQSEAGTRGRAMITLGGDRSGAPSLLGEALGGVNEQVFEHLFAIGLDELQRLSTLHGDEVARHIYDVSLGREGERIVKAWQSADAARRGIYDDTARTGEVVRVSAALAEMDERIAALKEVEDRQHTLRDEQHAAERHVADMRSRQQGLQHQLRGHLLLERAWAPWQRQQQLLKERESIPERAAFPADIVAQLDRRRSELDDLRRQREQLRTSADSLRTELKNLQSDRQFGKVAHAMRATLADADSLRTLEQSLAAQQQSARQLRHDLDDSLARLGSGWSDARLRKLDASPTATARLFEQAARYRAALRLRAREIGRYKRLGAAWQQQQAAFAQTAGGESDADPKERHAELTESIRNLEEACDIEARLNAVRQSAEILRERADEAEAERDLPPYFYLTLTIFGIAGGLLLLLGLQRWSDTAAGAMGGVAGAVLLLLGVCCIAVTLAMKRLFDPESDAPESLRSRLTRTVDEQSALERDFRRITRALPQFADASDAETDQGAESSWVQKLIAAGREVVAVDVAADRAHRLQARRQQLSVLRGRIRERQRAVSQARREWCQTLKSHGFDESLRIAAALDIWQRAHEARGRLDEWQRGQSEIAAGEQAVRQFDQRMAALREEMGDGKSPPARREDVLRQWRGRLEELAAAGAQRKLLKEQRRQCRTRYVEVTRSLCEQRAALHAWLKQHGIRDRDDLLRQQARIVRLAELNRMISEANDAVAAAAAGDPDLAIVEQDLLQYDAAANRTAIDSLRSELADLETDLVEAHEDIGRRRLAIEQIESDRTPIRLRFDRARLAAELDDAVSELASAHVAREALDALRATIERDSQPAILTRAARHLQRLTLNRYSRVWTPAGERRLMIDDAEQQTFAVDQLSNGTREQLFLAIRLALTDQLWEQGVELPLVLDDVFVNFDQPRTEAAVDALLHEASQGRQILFFTCHQHLAKLFAQRGAHLVRLPEPDAAHERRLVG